MHLSYKIKEKIVPMSSASMILSKERLIGSACEWCSSCDSVMSSEQ